MGRRGGLAVASPGLRLRLLPEVFRAALPLYVGQAVVYAAAFTLNVALIFWIFPDAPDAIAHYGIANNVLQWTTVAGIFGLATGVLRVIPEHPEAARDVHRTASLVAFLASLVVYAAVAFVPPLGDALMRDPVAQAGFLVLGLKGPLGALIALTTSTLHAQNRLTAKAAVEGAERVAVLAFGLAGARWLGLPGLFAGSFAGSAVAWGLSLIVVRPERWHVRWDLFAQVFRVGRMQLAFFLVETFRPLLLLRLMTDHGPGAAETGLLVTAMSIVLPMVAIPEILAQALYPSMVGRGGETADAEHKHRTLLIEMVVLSIPALLVFAGLAAWVLPKVGDGSYAGAVGAVLALLPGVAAHGLMALTGYVVLLRGRLHLAVVASVVSLAVTWVAARYLVPEWGATGAGVALSLALVVRSGLLLLAARL